MMNASIINECDRPNLDLSHERETFSLLLFYKILKSYCEDHPKRTHKTHTDADLSFSLSKRTEQKEKRIPEPLVQHSLYILYTYMYIYIYIYMYI